MRLGPAGFKPKRRWGQNFLVDPGALAAIAAAFRPSPGDRVLEIGPGDGALTRRIAPRVDSLLAVEVDPDLAAALRTELEGGSIGSGPAAARVRVLEGDVLSFEPDRLLMEAGATPGHPARLLGNLPYNIATVIILKYLTRHDLVRDLVVMVQREVAERILAPTHTKEYGSLTVLCRTFAKVERIRRLRPGSFRPRPKVESEVIRLALHDPGGAAGADPDGYARFVHECFGQRRKTFLNNLARVLAPGGDDAHEQARSLLVAAAIDPGGRPEEVPPEGFERLYVRLKSRADKRIEESSRPV